jgi:hypothetical protein
MQEMRYRSFPYRHKYPLVHPLGARLLKYVAHKYVMRPSLETLHKYPKK